MNAAEIAEKFGMTAEQLEQMEYRAQVNIDAAKLPKSSWKPAWFASPIDLPEKRVGALRIEHQIYPEGSHLDIVSLREAILQNTTPQRCKLSEPLRVHKLVSDERGVWMSDLPCELNQMAEGLHDLMPSGHVLVGGLGLGILPGMLYDARHALGIKSITVVERDADVIALCKGAGYRVVHDGIEQFIKRSRQRWDAVMLDTWQGQGETTFWREVLPLKRLVRRTWGAKPKLWLWKEREMWGQAYMALRMRGYTHWQHPKLKTGMEHDEALFFLQQVGLPAWEQKYGEAIDHQRKRDDE